MKYLRRINEDENIINKSDIENCFVDLTDYGFNVNFITKKYNTFVSISKGVRNDEFKTSEIIESFLFAIPYIESEYGFILDGVSVLGYSSGGWRNYNSAEDIEDILIIEVLINFKNNYDPKQTNSFVKFNGVKFRYNEGFIPDSHVSESDIKECFVELVDYGFDVDIKSNTIIRSHTAIDRAREREKMKKNPGFYVTIGKTGVPVTTLTTFGIADVKESLMFAIPYLKTEYDFSLDSITFNHFVPGSGMESKRFNSMNEAMMFFIGKKTGIRFILLIFSSDKGKKKRIR